MSRFRQHRAGRFQFIGEHQEIVGIEGGEDEDADPGSGERRHQRRQDTDLPEVRIGESDSLVTSIPASGVLTVYGLEDSAAEAKGS